MVLPVGFYGASTEAAIQISSLQKSFRRAFSLFIPPRYLIPSSDSGIARVVAEVFATGVS